MYCSNRSLRSTPKSCRGDCSQVCLLFDGQFVEFLAESRRREPLLSCRVQHYFRGEDSNDDPFAFPTQPLKSRFSGWSHVHMNRGNNA